MKKFVSFLIIASALTVIIGLVGYFIIAQMASESGMSISGVKNIISIADQIGYPFSSVNKNDQFKLFLALYYQEFLKYGIITLLIGCVLSLLNKAATTEGKSTSSVKQNTIHTSHSAPSSASMEMQRLAEQKKREKQRQEWETRQAKLQQAMKSTGTQIQKGTAYMNTKVSNALHSQAASNIKKAAFHGIQKAGEKISTALEQRIPSIDENKASSLYTHLPLDSTISASDLEKTISVDSYGFSVHLEGKINDLSFYDAHVTDKGFLIGREETCNLVLNDHHVSRKHCKLIAQRDHLYLENLSQTNPVKLNDQLVQETSELHCGDRITVGVLILTVSW